jgi:hypothetical protein
MVYIEEISKNITNDGIFIWLLFIFFFLFLIYIILELFKKNKKLEEELKRVNKENKTISDSIKTSKTEIKVKEEIPLETISKNRDSSKIPDISNLKKDKEQEEVNSSTGKAYQKNMLKNIKAPTSPVNINNQSPSIKELKMNLNDFIKKERKNGNNVKILTSKDYEASSSSTINYMEEVSKRLEEATDNSPIELTDYEKKQEEEAIISYKELIENKDKIYQITDDEADIEFINELKNFRDSLSNK